MKSNIPSEIKATILSVLADEGCVMIALVHLFHPEVSEVLPTKLAERDMQVATCNNLQFAQIVAEILRVIYPADASHDVLCKYIIKHILRGVING